MAALILENDRLRAELCPVTGNLTLTNRTTGHTWAASRVPAVVHYFEAWRDRARQGAVLAPAWEITASAGGGGEARLDCFCPANGLGFSLVLRLREDHLEVAIPWDSLRAEQPWMYWLSRLEVFPLLAAVAQGEPGYLVLPNDGGVLVYFDPALNSPEYAMTPEQLAGVHTAEGVREVLCPDPGRPVEYSSKVYTEQSAVDDLPNLPLYGVISGEQGLAVMLLSGQYDAEIRLLARQGAAKTYSLHPVFCYRDAHGDQADPLDRVCRLYPLAGDQANYVGVVRRYQRYLIEEEGVKPLAERIAENPDLAILARGFTSKTLLGHKRFRNHPDYHYEAMDGKGQLEIFLTYNDVRELMRRLHGLGVEAAYLNLVGSNPEGHDGMYPTILPVETAFGTMEEFHAMIAEAKGYGYLINVHVNYRDAYEYSPDWSEDLCMRDAHGDFVRGGIWPAGFAYAECPGVALERFIRDDVLKLQDLGFVGPLYFDVVQGVLLTCYDPRHPLNRRQYAEAIRAYLSYARSLFGSVATEMGMADVVGIADITYSLPVPKGRLDYTRHTSLRACGLVGEGVPLLTFLFHGLCCHIVSDVLGEPELLQAVEYGALPRHDWRDDEPFTKLEMDARAWHVLCQELGHLQTVFVAGHQKLAPGVYTTLYENGERVVVNYTEAAFASAWGEVAANGYLHVRV